MRRAICVLLGVLGLLALASSASAQAATCDPWYSSWPPDSEELISYVSDILSDDAVAGRFDLSEIESATVLGPGALEDLLDDDEFNFFGVPKNTTTTSTLRIMRSRLGW